MYSGEQSVPLGALVPANFAFTRERFNNELKSISSLILTMAQRRVVLDFYSVVYYVVRANHNVTFSCAKLCCICMKPVSCVLIFVLIWLLRTQFKVLDEIKHLFGQFRRYSEIWWVCKIYGRLGSASPSIDFTNPAYFYRPSVTDQISNNIFLWFTFKPYMRCARATSCFVE